MQAYEVVYNAEMERQKAKAEQRSAPPLPYDSENTTQKVMDRCFRSQPQRWWTLEDLAVAIGISRQATKVAFRRWRRRVLLETTRPGGHNMHAYRLVKP